MTPIDSNIFMSGDSAGAGCLQENADGVGRVILIIRKCQEKNRWKAILFECTERVQMTNKK